MAILPVRRYMELDTMSTNPILTTSLAEICSFRPCVSGWEKILTARKPISHEDYNIQFPLVDCLESNSVADVCWLLGKRKEEIQICVRFAQMCANSVQEANNKFEVYAAAYAANAAHAANAAYAAAADAAAAYDKQKELNKQFLIQCINEYQP